MDVKIQREAMHQASLMPEMFTELLIEIQKMVGNEKALIAIVLVGAITLISLGFLRPAEVPTTRRKRRNTITT